jgi:hypothetical protein
MAYDMFINEIDKRHRRTGNDLSLYNDLQWLADSIIESEKHSYERQLKHNTAKYSTEIDDLRFDNNELIERIVEQDAEISSLKLHLGSCKGNLSQMQHRYHQSKTRPPTKGSIL